jgi:hypothetical protein
VFNPSPIVPRNGIRGVTGMVRVARMGPYPIMPRENVRWALSATKKEIDARRQWRSVRWTRATHDASA